MSIDGLSYEEQKEVIKEREDIKTSLMKQGKLLPPEYEKATTERAKSQAQLARAEADKIRAEADKSESDWKARALHIWRGITTIIGPYAIIHLIWAIVTILVCYILVVKGWRA